MHDKLFLTGPVEVKEDILRQLSKPQIGHRTKEFKQLFREITGKVQTLLSTRNKVFISSSSAMGIMEATVRNCVNKKSLHLVNGAFGERWAEVAQRCGKAHDKIEPGFGKIPNLQIIDDALATGMYDCFMMVHNDTSVGLTNPIEDIAKVLNKYPEVLFCVDAVTSMAGVKLEVDRLGIDVIFSSNHKCFGLPPIMTIFALSEKALEKSKSAVNKGYYFDFQLFLKHHNKDTVLVSPPIPQMYALNYQLDKMFAEGLENRYARHKEMGEYVRIWAKNLGFGIFPKEGYESPSVSCIENTKGIDIKELILKVQEKHKMVFSNGYRDLREKTFRIGHLGDVTLDEVKELCEAIEKEVRNGQSTFSRQY